MSSLRCKPFLNSENKTSRFDSLPDGWMPPPGFPSRCLPPRPILACWRGAGGRRQRSKVACDELLRRCLSLGSESLQWEHPGTSAAH